MNHDFLQTVFEFLESVLELLFKLIISCIRVFGKKKSLSKYENYSKWNMFWPSTEVMASVVSLMLTMLIGYILHSDPRWEGGTETIVPVVVAPQ